MLVTSYPPEINTGTVTTYLPLATPWGWNNNCSDNFQWHNGSLWASFDPAFAAYAEHQCGPPEFQQWYDKEEFVGPDGLATTTSLGPLAPPTNVPNISVASIFVRYQSSTLSLYCPPEYKSSSAEDFPDCVSAIQPRTPVTYMSPTIMGRDTTWATKTTQFTEITNVHAFPVQGWNINDTGGHGCSSCFTCPCAFLYSHHE
ncbi:hypothetical protein BDV37DRAFT_16417 [Aspergillus pseudonomiae]|uniref:Uncharacterized protein n=1 Tax=Aspergillus pseudonomiae TaxID=1506151 RepID=A0A5N7CZ99_9EURO|nr:uncharacterized protein BDV37DRAFT_16417 [Aspergillus pseudonomiae]KAE8398913.1 hypothetical protein BDV37DRAFT_16417 [Aspergillus pseudonomiae]